MKLTGKILVVDDDNLTLEFFEIMLTKLGYDVVEASDGLEALDMVKLHNPDIILLDNKMPNMDGFEVVQILKKQPDFRKYKDTPIIMFSAIHDPADKVLGLEMGIEDFVAKPFHFSEILARIRNIIRHKEISKQLLKRERRLAILESLNTNLIAFMRHIKKPLETLLEDAKNLKVSDETQVKNFIAKFSDDYDEVQAMLDSLEDEIIDIETKGNKLKEEELSLDELEKRINKHLDSVKEDA